MREKSAISTQKPKSLIKRIQSFLVASPHKDAPSLPHGLFDQTCKSDINGVPGQVVEIDFSQTQLSS